MLNLLYTIKNLSLINFISTMFVELAVNEMDERDYNKVKIQAKQCPLRKWAPHNHK